MKKTKFSNGVYNIIKKIPRGKTLTYQQIALKLGNPGLARAVGNALNKNRNPKVPCHRVIKSNGEIGGYRYGTNRKTSLLSKEGIIIENGKIAS